MKSSHLAHRPARALNASPVALELLEPRVLFTLTAGQIVPNGGVIQRSSVTSVSASFAGGNVHASLAGGDLVLWNRTTHAFVDATGAGGTYNDNTNTATWTFSSPLP